MKKLFVFLTPLLFLAACKKDLTSLNEDPKNPSSVPSFALYTNAQRTLSNTLTSSSVNLNIFRLIVQYWTETTYTDESNYDLQTRQIPRGVWNALYRDVLRDLQETKKLIPTDVLDGTGKPDAPRQKNQLAVVDITEVYAWYYLVTTFGNVPYSEALNIDKPFPKYDDQKAIFTDLLKRIDADIAAIVITGESFGNADVIYGGDMEAWKKFAASLKLKMGMTLADSDPALSKTIVEAAVATGVFTSNADNAEFKYLSGPPNTNPVWVDLVQSGRKDFVGTTTIIDGLKALNDPRLPYYFTLDGTGNEYTGGEPGASNNYTTYSKPSGSSLVKGSIGRITSADFPALLMDYSEVEFFLAEAKERGYNVPITAGEHYNKAITASILYWGGSSTQAVNYLAQPAVAYATAAGDYKQKIGVQKYLGLYNRGWDEWIEQRRLDQPAIIAPSSAQSVYPVRFTYNVDEQNINTANYNAASTAIGGDKVGTKLFWDKN
ncbi:MAG: SusD/RagB family nutrient-binding outer membrane lipoprotein [Chitinophagaceae bacterium]|nr:SusD/RagB family nutrient-binding outer membrane lipoprotein [Chitinophagaceae bacterium]